MRRPRNPSGRTARTPTPGNSRDLAFHFFRRTRTRSGPCNFRTCFLITSVPPPRVPGDTVRMTRARPLAPGLGNPPLLQRLLDAVTCAFVCLVQGVVTTFGMRSNRRPHDWHMGSSHEALPQTKPDIHLKEAPTPTVSFSGLSRESLLDHPTGLAISPSETINQDSRDKPENDPVDVEAPEQEPGKARLPHDLLPEARRAQGEGGDPASAQSPLPKRTAFTPLIPTNVGSQGEPCALFRPAASSLPTQANRSWIPTFVGMSGGCCLESA